MQDRAVIIWKEVPSCTHSYGDPLEAPHPPDWPGWAGGRSGRHLALYVQEEEDACAEGWEDLTAVPLPCKVMQRDSPSRSRVQGLWTEVWRAQ